MTCQTHFGSKLAATVCCHIFKQQVQLCHFWSASVTNDCKQSQSNFELREVPVSRAFLYISFTVSSKEAPLHVSQQGSYGKRCSISRANGLFIHLYLSEFPVKELSQEMGEKHTVTVHGCPCGQKAYIQWGVAWFPKGIVYDTAITTPVPCSLRHDTFHLGLGRSEPH